MVPANEQLEVAWHSLASIGDTGDGWRSIAISSTGAPLVHAGRRYPGGTEAILVRFLASSIPATVRLPEGGGFLIELVTLDAGVVWIALTRRDGGSPDLFAAMASDVVAALSSCRQADEAKSLATLLGRVRAWQEFMRKGGQPLSAEGEVGLFGELSVLYALVNEGIDVATACEAWRGPLDGLRDFELGTGGVEVKSTLATAGFRARVGSLEQLDDTVRQPLFLAAVRLRQLQEGGRSLAECVEMMQGVIAGDALAERLFAERITASGFRHEHAGSYVRRFDIHEMRILRVQDGFPRLTPHSVPVGVERATYEIEIDGTTAESCDLSKVLMELKGI
ncbi:MULTISPECIES: PD-(D/E)XK motif protein [Paraburkholderia]|uniref:PD-(D/E)XK motif protein n=1 Tax=Paraburkholderia TaxID=1822464 RepID=UPI00225BDB0F|nr:MULTISPECIES: PD-(D/E)XK motif protein [Paraburkholderia]MCX4177496.1 PD-(D/E)XK motif protein [Paraburkholderia madseniana]MDQ6465485.1 PD-(D/E)XK motif protein [Paraburkholderia madseniana]